ncbi:AsnC family transcriptional regulator [Aliiroseovarius crassostreae]|uniref:AsnC family transcriptional regulator n=1 Tax=Aliiroseovarius crassostreae TaxID=154981 RepID=A0A0P7KIV1_9RHOB|nr:Lrp/AsnC family transcriptional regulator [Aliiroseovarius crassostreae]KPN61869.1 AsnC family transcriptional regulator [Aliiroseovarius crassostreae]
MLMDHLDARLLSALQKNAHLTAQELGEILHLSPSQAGRRRQRLEELGIVKGYTVRLDPLELGLSVQSFIQVEMSSHTPEAAHAFSRMIETHPEVISAWTLTGAADYLLRVYCANLAALNHLIHDVLLPHPSVARVQSQIVMNQLKSDAPLPVSPDI